MSASTIKIPAFVSKPNIVDADFFTAWSVADAKMVKFTYLELKSDILSTGLTGDLDLNANNILNVGFLNFNAIPNNLGITSTVANQLEFHSIGATRLTIADTLITSSVGLDMATNDILNAVFDSTSNVWRTSGTSTLTSNVTIAGAFTLNLNNTTIRLNSNVWSINTSRLGRNSNAGPALTNTSSSATVGVIRPAWVNAAGLGGVPGSPAMVTNSVSRMTWTDTLITSAVNLSLSTVDIITDATTGTKFATAITQKIAFWNATPVVQPAHIVDADGTLADITTKFNTLLAQMAATGLQAAA